MDADRRNDTGIFRYTDVEYTPEGHTDAYRWDDFLGIAGGHVYSAMDTIDMVSTGGQYEGDEPEHAYACEIVDFSGLGYGWGTGYPDSLSVDAIGIDFPSGEHNIFLNFSPITHAPDVDGRKLFCHETTIGYDLNADSWSGATIGPDFWTLDGKEAREFAENIGLDRLAARACVRLGIEAPGLKGREALPIPKATDVVPEPSVQAEAAKNAVTEVTVIPAWVSFPDEPGTAQYRLFCEQDTEPLDIDEQIFFSGYTAEELCGMVGKTVNGDFTIVGVEEPEKMKATYVRPVQKAYNPADMAAAAKKTAAAKLSGDGSGGGKRI